MKARKLDPLTREVAAWFGVPLRRLRPQLCRPERREANPTPEHEDLLGGTLRLIVGPSGAGKSTRLRRLLRRARSRGVTTIDLATLRLPDRPAIELLRDGVNLTGVDPGVDPGGDNPDALTPAIRRLTRVGLGEAGVCLRRPRQLSTGERWRLTLAVALTRASTHAAPTPVDPSRPVLLACDEFGATLDRVTACCVARTLRRAIDASDGRLAAVVVTSHDDVRAALAPDVLERF